MQPLDRFADQLRRVTKKAGLGMTSIPMITKVISRWMILIESAALRLSVGRTEQAIADNRTSAGGISQ